MLRTCYLSSLWPVKCSFPKSYQTLHYSNRSEKPQLPQSSSLPRSLIQLTQGNLFNILLKILQSTPLKRHKMNTPGIH
jgi:hypothetical protein